jgi:3-phenylpropionate/trans-cinnamate dioxygenase ferredoxin subunit
MPSHVVAATAEFPPGTRRVIDIDGRAVVVFNVKGE